MQRVIVDTSSLLFGMINRKDVLHAVAVRFPGCTVVISRGIVRELAGISKNKGVKGASAGAALEALKTGEAVIESVSGNVDRWILSSAKANPDCAVVTNDTELYKKLKSLNIKCLKLTRDGVLR